MELPPIRNKQTNMQNETKQPAVSAADHSTDTVHANGLPVKPGDGLVLSGLVVSVNTTVKQWEDEAPYNLLTATVSNGRRTINYHADDKKGQKLPEIMPFTRIKVDVEYVHSDKGSMSVRGRIINE